MTKRIELKFTVKCVIPSILQKNASVAVLGASGGIGQPLSLLLKLSPFVSRLSLYDIAHTPGVAADLSHISTRAQVKGFIGADQLHSCLEGAEVVLIPAGVPRKPGKFLVLSHIQTWQSIMVLT